MVATSAITEYLFIPYIAGLVLLMVSLGASAKQTGLIPSWLAVAGYVLAVVALIPHEVAFIGSCSPCSGCWSPASCFSGAPARKPPSHDGIGGPGDVPGPSQ